MCSMTPPSGMSCEGFLSYFKPLVSQGGRSCTEDQEASFIHLLSNLNSTKQACQASSWKPEQVRFLLPFLNLRAAFLSISCSAGYFVKTAQTYLTNNFSTLLPPIVSLYNWVSSVFQFGCFTSVNQSSSRWTCTGYYVF